ncbi:hypothetical protein HOD19_03780 [bacterium]|jgi:hypothetical protein|nr:hypothetical protein [bacterium]MBT4648933.1 hypothetical protein [bacterium]
MESFYRKVYLRSWRIVKNNWYLLFFGLFVSTLGLTGDFKALSNLEANDIISTTLVDWINIFHTFAVADITLDKLPTLLMLIGTFLFLAVILVMAISSQGAIIQATANDHKKTNKNTLINNLQTGVENFWPLFGINILNKLISFVFVVGAIIPIIYLLSLSQNASFMNFLMTIIVFFVLVPIAVIISFVTRYGASYIIIKKQSLTQAFFNAWRLFRVNWIISLENALALLALTILYGLIIISLLAFVVTPFLILGYLVAQISIFGFWILIIAGSLAAIILFLTAVSLFGTYYTVVWTELFIELTNPGKNASKAHRFAKKHLPRLAK